MQRHRLPKLIVRVPVTRSTRRAQFAYPTRSVIFLPRPRHLSGGRGCRQGDVDVRGVMIVVRTTLRMVTVMSAWLTIIAGVVGAAIALVGEQFSRRWNRRTHVSEVVLEQCALLIALSEEFRYRAWEESALGLQGRVDSWDLASHRMAKARLEILCRDAAFLAALQEFSSLGRSYGSHLRLGDLNDAELKDLHAREAVACEMFEKASAQVVRRRLGSL